MTLKPKISMLNRSEMEKIHEATLKILKDTGVAFRSEEALAYFQNHGFRIENETVFFKANQVQSALEQCPEQFTFSARNQAHSLTIGDKEPVIQPASGCVYVQEPNKPRRLGLLDDYIRYQQLLQTSDVVHLVGGNPIVPSDLNPGSRHFHQIYQTLKHTDKPVIGWTATGRQTNEMMDMLAIAFGGEEQLQTQHVIGTGINPLSPLAYGTETLDCVIAAAKRNQILFVCPAAMSGITAPLDLMGTALMQNAELLACTVLIQLVNPGLPVVYCPASVVGNMKRASFCTGSPESMLINLINLQLGQEYYHLPTRSLTGSTDAKVPDFQAGAESMQNLMLSMLGGSEIINEALGTLESYMTLSFEKYLMDEENFRRLQRIQKGVSLVNLEESVTLINEVGINGDYLTHTSTFNKFRELWQPTLSNWESYDQWIKNENKDLLTLAQKRVETLINSAPETLLHQSLDQELMQYMNKAGAFS